MSNLENLTCWLLLDNNDSLWIDEQRCDRIVHYIPEGRFGDLCILPRASVIDEYLAHVIKNELPKNINFKMFID